MEPANRFSAVGCFLEYTATTVPSDLKAILFIFSGWTAVPLEGSTRTSSPKTSLFISKTAYLTTNPSASGRASVQHSTGSPRWFLVRKGLVALDPAAVSKIALSVVVPPSYWFVEEVHEETKAPIKIAKNSLFFMFVMFVIHL